MEKKNLNKTKIYNIIAIILIASIMLITVSEFIPKRSGTAPQNSKLVMQEDVIIGSTKEEQLEARLEKILSNISGVGQVKVMITFETRGEVTPGFNTVESKETTEEVDSSGGKRVIESQNITQTIVTQNTSRGNEPILLKTIEPEIKGVIVVAEGAENAHVKEKLFNAVKTVLQVSGHKVQVYSKKI
ncbi:stage III sporulation protein AG [Alkalithermobacter thermoalcaliphilus JW-YL-7 = DSM 7308]|uniref:Sporulation stage III, protein AG n=1 Tax=Alkalithermobacter thermoalcaliphilus JW-YL-7 = DSM 7308 TaxID=1121328 RepID=A0A150FPZ8_CLOPD|nr:sporulation stage III, protein AG [[Clostridium] paradoxum JW-YL-7 = DSM 7308]SHK94907.1 stage III sporulation protein AG [[Clostridium] paradoxum JW-YL-7 = DSM 7308]